MQQDNCYTPLCPKRETCTLWINALYEIKMGTKFLSIANPKLIEQAGGYDHCPLYYEHKLRTFARGLVWRYNDITLTQLDHLQQALNNHFGKNTMVRMRCGYEAISPEEQAIIASIFERIAPSVKPRYNTFEQHYTKPPRVEGKAARKLLK